jgi:hypothetical protein
VDSVTGLDTGNLEELCVRLLGRFHPDGPTSVDLVVSQLPESIAADIPIAADWRVVGSALYSRRGRPTLLETVIDAPNSFAELVGPFQAALGATGWTVLEPTGPMHGGFVSADFGEGRVFRRDGQGPILSIRGVSREGVATDVRLRLEWDTRPYLPPTPHVRPDGADRLPSLSAPADSRLRRQHGGGGSGHWSSESTIQTDRSVGEIEAHFAKQLAGASWRRVGGSADDTVGWSSWELPGDGQWRGLLLVLAAFRSGERSLTLRVEQHEPGEEDWSSYSVTSEDS